MNYKTTTEIVWFVSAWCDGSSSKSQMIVPTNFLVVGMYRCLNKRIMLMALLHSNWYFPLCLLARAGYRVLDYSSF
jgi:hypothetical protein